MSYRNFFPIFLLLILITTLNNYSADALQKSPNMRPVSAKKQTVELKIQLMKLERDIKIYPEKVLRNPSSRPNIQRQKVRFLSRLRDIENQISKFNNPKTQILNLKVHSLRQEVRKLENAVNKVALREKFQEYRKQRASKPKPSCDLIASTISGSVVDADTAAPIPNREVDIFDSGGSWISYGYTDSSGNYSIGGLSDDTYYARTYGNDHYIDELYDNIVCEPYCDPTTGTAIILNGSATADFALQIGGSISGTITDSSTSQPITDASVSIYDSTGSFVSYGYTDSSGNYTVTGSLAGDYYAKSYNYENYINEVYDDHVCEPDCNPLIGDPIAVSAGQDTPGIDFALRPGGIISGTIKDSATSNPIDSSLFVYDSSGDYYARGFTDGSGNYQVGSLLTGNYFILTSNYDYYVDELFDNIQCYRGNCDPTSGNPVSVTEGSTTPGIDFALDAGGSFSGQVSGDGNPIPYSSVNVYDSEGFYVAYGYADDSGNYSIPGLINGNYHATAYNYYGFVDELYDDIPCQNGCDTTNGTPIPVTLGSDTPGINFDLNQGGKISGKMTDETTANPISGGVLIYDVQGLFTSYAYTDGNGNYTTGNGLADGDYYAISYNYYGYMDELHDNIPCAFSKCDPLGGTKIAVTSGNTTPNIDFALNTGGKITGNVSSTLGSPISGFYVNLFSSTGTFLTQAFAIDGFGNYEVTGIPTGNYYVSTYNFEFFADELYNNHPCSGGFCDLTPGDLVPVTVGSTTPNIDFALDDGGSLSGNVSDAQTGQPVQYAEVDIYDSSGNWVTYGYSDGTGHYSSSYNYIGLAAGDYYVITNTYGAYRDELYDDVSCPAGICDLSSGDPVPVTMRQDTPGIDFSLNSCDANIYFTPYNLPAGTIGIPYNKTFSAFGGTPPYQFLLKYGNLPEGFTLDSATGVLSGTAANPGENNFVIAAVDSNGCAGIQGYALNFYLPNSLFSDNFEDGNLPTNWLFLKGSWTESGGALHGTHDRKTYAIASPAFPGCSDCSVEAEVETAGDPGSKVSLLGWWIDKKNFVEVMFKEAQDRVVLKLRINGSVVAKAKAVVSIDPNQTYDVKVEYQNSAYHVVIDGVEQITLPASAPVSGTVGFLVKGTTGTFGMIEVD